MRFSATNGPAGGRDLRLRTPPSPTHTGGERVRRRRRRAAVQAQGIAAVGPQPLSGVGRGWTPIWARHGPDTPRAEWHSRWRGWEDQKGVTGWRSRKSGQPLIPRGEGLWGVLMAMIQPPCGNNDTVRGVQLPTGVAGHPTGTGETPQHPTDHLRPVPALGDGGPLGWADPPSSPGRQLGPAPGAGRTGWGRGMVQWTAKRPSQAVAEGQRGARDPPAALALEGGPRTGQRTNPHPPPPLPKPGPVCGKRGGRPWHNCDTRKRQTGEMNG